MQMWNIFYSLFASHICRCLLEKDPIAQKHAARIKKLRGTYDRYGNRRPPDFIANAQGQQKKTRRWKKRPSSDDRGRMLDDESDEDEDGEGGIRMGGRARTPETQMRRTPPRVQKRKQQQQQQQQQQQRSSSSSKAAKPRPSPDVSPAPRSRTTRRGETPVAASRSAKSTRAVAPSPAQARLSAPKEGGKKQRPKSAPKFKSQERDGGEYSSDGAADEESSEADIPLPSNDDEEEDDEDEEESSEEEDRCFSTSIK